MVSNIFPIYRNDFLEGVSGLDVTIESFVQNILNLNIPWQASIFMIDKNGVILAMQEKVGDLFNLKKLTTHVYNKSIQETIEKPQEYNIFTSGNKSLKDQMRAFFNSKDSIRKIDIDGERYLMNQEVISETDWRMITLVKESIIFAPIIKLKMLSKLVGYIAIGMMIVFYTLFFLFLLRKSGKLTAKIATPIENLSTLSDKLGETIEIEKQRIVGIVEIDQLSQNFNRMATELETRTKLLINSQLSEKIEKKEAELFKKLAVMDRLTNLYNRHKLDEVLAVENNRAKRFNTPYGVILLDIDYFKSVNDTHGHQVGDQVLVELVKVLRKNIRETDNIGRWGGEEFLIVCPEINKNGLFKLSEKLRVTIEEHEFPVINNKTCSFGISQYQQGDKVDNIISRADKGLYRAKENGRNRIEFQ